MYSRFSNDMLDIYKKTPETLKTILYYELFDGDFSATDNENNNILHLIAKNGDENLMSIILRKVNKKSSHKNLLNQKNYDGDIPIHIAISRGYKDIAEMLHLAGTDMSIKTKDGSSIEVSEERNKYYDKKKCSENINEKDMLNIFRSLDDVVDIKPYDSFNISLTNTPGLNKIMLGGSKESDKIHDEVLQNLITIMDNNEDYGRAIKKALWSQIKEKFPDLSGNEKTKKLLEFSKDKKIVANLTKNKDELLAELKKVREENASKKIVKEAKDKSKEQKSKAEKSDSEKSDLPKKKKKTE